MHRALLVSFLVFVAFYGVSGQPQRRKSGSSGSATASGGGTAFTSTGGSGGTGSGRVKTTVSVSAGGSKKKRTQVPRGFEDFFTDSSTEGESAGESKGKAKTKRSESVSVDEDTVVSSSSVESSTPASASAFASIGPKGQEGSASTTADGVTRTVAKKKNRHGKSKTERTEEETPSKSEAEGQKSKGKKQRKSKKETVETTFSSDFFGIRTCRGLAKFKCCDDRDFATINGVTYCGCWGDGKREEYCSYERVSADPLIVRDVFGATFGEACRCEDDAATNSNRCRGEVKRECCDQYNGQKQCGCVGKVCQYKRVSNQPLTWISRFTKKSCTC